MKKGSSLGALTRVCSHKKRISKIKAKVTTENIDNIELVIASKNFAEALKAEEKSIDFIATAVELRVDSYGIFLFFFGGITGISPRLIAMALVSSSSYARSMSKYFPA